MLTTATPPAAAATAARPGDARGRPGPRRLLRGPADQPAWARPALLVLLAGTAALYLWNLGASGSANSFYAAAVQAGTQSWKAFFFGSFDASNFITVDKPPAALWVMALSGRIFGFSSWSMLAPQALEGVAAVGLLYAAVRRWAGPAAGLFAGAVLALTPVAALMFRFNNPDALLTLLLVAGGYCVVRATERASAKWLMLAGVCVGFGFLTKMLQAFLVLPAFALVYLVAAPTGLRRRLLHLLAAGLAVVASAGWWVATVELWPASARPYIGGSTGNSVLELALGYNGLSRIFGNGGPSAGPGGGPVGGPGGGGAGFGGASGITRMFGPAFGNEVSWLLPAALIALVAGLWLTRRAPRTDRTRAALLLWGGWLLVTGLVFSYMRGIVHPYYAVALAPAIAAPVAVTGGLAWRRRHTWSGRGTLALMAAGTGIWSFVLLARTPDWHPELRYAVVVGTALAAAALLAGARAVRRVAVGSVAVAALAGLAGTGAYTLDTAATAHGGAIPAAGPAAAAGSGPAGALRTLRTLPPGAATPPQATGGGQAPVAGPPQVAGGPEAATASAEVANLLKATTTTWAAATSGSQEAASLQLSSGRPVMSIGGFSGGDPAPTLVQFQRYVAAGRIGYFVPGGMGGPGGRGGSSEITIWVTSHFTATTVGGQTVYDLTKPTS